MQQLYKTVLGDVTADDLGLVLPHEHICCYSEYLYQMAGNRYLDKAKLLEVSAKHLTELKARCGLKTFIDCTPVNIGRDVELLKAVSEKSGVNIICSTGFYYTEEPVLYNSSTEQIAQYMIQDAINVNAGVIKCAAEAAEISPYIEKILISAAKAQLSIGLPVVLHSNGANKNGLDALEILLTQGVKPEAITVGHLSDAKDIDYVKRIASYGCFIGLDRMYGNLTEDYISKKVRDIQVLCDAGYEKQLLVSHDALFFNGFDQMPSINETPRFAYIFEHILPQLDPETVENITVHNPVRMLSCGI